MLLFQANPFLPAFLSLFQPITTYFSIFQPIPGSVLFQHIPVFCSLCQPIPAYFRYSKLLQPFTASSSLCSCFQLSKINIVQPIPAYLSIIKHIPAFSSLIQPILAYFSLHHHIPVYSIKY